MVRSTQFTVMRINVEGIEPGAPCMTAAELHPQSCHIVYSGCGDLVLESQVPGSGSFPTLTNQPDYVFQE